MRWREQGARKGDKRQTVAESAGLSYQVTHSMSGILLANCAHEVETANSQVLPCNTVSCFTVRVHIFVDCCNPERQDGLSVL